MIGKTISHYKIVEKLGEGGMGVVYKAQDLKLDRIVALKFLPHHLTVNDAEKARFLQEAKAAAALNHPNACSIFRIDEHDGQQFIEMEYVDGMTLRAKVSSSPLKMGEAITYALQIGEALNEAHGKGIVHRDIKAENIMINSKNQIKVMDFGLAKLKGSLKLTKTSSTVGTLAYMAPEQIQGGEVDARSDIFSFGVVVFEMLTGKLPFRGEHDAAMMYSILNEEPEPIQKYVADAPSEIIHILNKSLDKDPEDRYQSVSEMIVDLRRVKKDSTRVVRRQEFQQPENSGTNISTPITQSPKTRLFSKQYVVGMGIVATLVLGVFFSRNYLRSAFGTKSDKKIIAVLPFENLGPNDKEYFVDGMTDEVTSRLSELSGLSVIASSSAKQYKKTAKSLKQIAEELGVNYILQGTVRWETFDGETHVRVNPSLVRVEDGTQAWSQSMESVLSSAFKLQSDIAARVASALDIALAKTEVKSLETALTENPEAYDYYLQSIEYSDRSISKSDFEIAEKLLDRAIHADPSFAAAYARFSRLHASMYWFFYDRSGSRAEKARAAAAKAIALAPQLSESHEAMGWYFYHVKLDYAKALEEFNAALKFRPNNSDVYYGIAAVMRRQGNMRGSVESFEKSIEGNPRASDIIRQLGETETLLREYEKADANFNKSLELTPDVTIVYWEKLKNLLLWKGESTDSRTILETARRLGKVNESDNIIQLMTFYVQSWEGNLDKAKRALDEANTNEIVNDQFNYVPTAMFRANLEGRKGNEQLAKLYYDSAKVLLELKQQSRPDDERVCSALGLTYAHLGQKNKAIQEATRGVDLLPIEKEAWRGSNRLIDLAEVYTIVGEHEKALDLLERLVSIPAEISRQTLVLETRWKPLSGNARFQKLVNGN